ncbi:MAG: glycosyltransferase [Vicinamibacteria bacterium]|nr:glycosyltransferase [Vicinamibacteria bacterium]
MGDPSFEQVTSATRMTERLKLAFVVQRYGLEIAGGAEYHCRLIAELLSAHAEVEVFTTCALDYVEWKNHYPEGETVQNGVRVRRFPVARQRDVLRFAALSETIQTAGHSGQDEEAWMDAQGPYSPALQDHVLKAAREGLHDALIFFSYRYWTTCRTLKPSRTPSIMAPTAEDDGLYRLGLFRPLFEAATQFAFNSVEERHMLETSLGRALPGEVVGVGSALPSTVDGAAFRKRHGIAGPFLLYVGRIDLNKGCPDLFDHFLRYRKETGSDLALVLIGRAVLEVPSDASIKSLGFLEEGEKWDALAASMALAIPSRLESLSMVTLEAFYAERPVVANAHCAVLRGQCRRSGGGLYYSDHDEFREILSVLEGDATLRARMGRAGHAYFDKHYAWPVILEKYLRLIDAARQVKAA